MTVDRGSPIDMRQSDPGYTGGVQDRFESQGYAEWDVYTGQVHRLGHGECCLRVSPKPFSLPRAFMLSHEPFSAVMWCCRR